MKKIYMSPAMIIVQLKRRHVLLAGSGPDTMSVKDECLDTEDEVY